MLKTNTQNVLKMSTPTFAEELLQGRGQPHAHVGPHLVGVSVRWGAVDPTVPHVLQVLTAVTICPSPPGTYSSRV